MSRKPPVVRPGNMRLLIGALMVSALILLGMYLVYRQGHREVTRQLISDQLTITRVQAGKIENSFRNLGILLSDLAIDMTRVSPEQLSSKLPELLKRHSRASIRALYVRDGQGNILASADPRQLTHGDLPIHLLGASTHRESGWRLVRVPEPCLLITEQGPQNRSGNQELVALVALAGLLAERDEDTSAMGELQLYAADGERLLPPADPPPTVATTDGQAAEQHLQALLADMTHGGSGAVILEGHGERPNRVFSYAPLSLAGSRFSLARVATGASIDAVNLSAFTVTTLFLCALGGGLALVFRLNRSDRDLGQKTLLLADQQRQITTLNRMAEEARQRADQLLAFAGDAMFFLDPGQGQFVEQNQAVCDLLGYSREELARLELDSLFSGQQKRRYQRLVKTVLKNGYGEEGELLFKRKDGTTFVGAVHARLGVLGERQLVHGTVRDVTRVKQIETELRRKNRDLALLNRIVHGAVSSHDQQSLLKGLLRTVIEALEADGGGVFLLRHAGSALHLAATRNVPQEVIKELSRIRPGQGLVGRVASSGQSRSTADLRHDRRRSCDSVLAAGWKGFLAVPVATGNRTLGVLFIYTLKPRVFTREETQLLVAIGRQVGTAVEGAELLDALRWQNRLTEASNRELEASRLRLKENLRRQQEATRTLERTERMKNNFLALASHELRTPLTYILSGAELLLENGPSLDQQQRRLLKAVHRGGERLQEIVNDLLEVARLEAQSIYLGREKIDLPPLLADLGSQFETRLAHGQLQLSIDLLPEVDIYGDPDHLRRAIQRILENAIKFTRPGGMIDISGKEITSAELLQRREKLKPFTTHFFDRPLGPGYLQLTVRDTGLGLDPEDQVRIFDKFYEVGDITSHHTSQTGFGGKGVGLGLTLVRGMIEAHGGMIWVESEGTADGGKGSSFHIVLPVEGAADETASISA